MGTQSEYEINISYLMRDELIKFVGDDDDDKKNEIKLKNKDDNTNNITFNEMYTVFDSAIDEMLTLMAASCNNFMQTFDFLQFKDEYLKKKKKQKNIKPK